MMRKSFIALAVTAASSAQAVDVPPAMLDYIDANLKSWVNDAGIVTAIRRQNAKTAGLSETEIIDRDNVWRAEVGSANTPMIDGVLNAPVSAFLSQQVTASDGRITEVFVMDQVGLNVAASAVTSDYWQGDEAKFLETYPKGAGAVFVDEVELDESTQAYQGQVSFSIVDPDSGAVIGAITVGLNANAFF